AAVPRGREPRDARPDRRRQLHHPRPRRADAGAGRRGRGDPARRLAVHLRCKVPDRYRQRDGVLPQRRHPPLRAAEARVLSLLARLGLRKAADEKADPRRLAAVGAAVRATLAEDPRAEPRGGREADLYTVPGFASPEECAALLALIERGAQPSPLFNDGGSGRTDIRTSSTHYFGNDPAALELGRRI